MDTNKTISIVVPAYNYAHYLPECIDSIRKQTYPIHEIIVVNDGSLDNTEEVCRNLNVTCLTKKNGGLSSARNYGIERATGDYIMCLDADDLLPPDSIALHMENAGKYIISQCGLQEFGERNNRHYPQGAILDTILLANTIYCNAVFPRKIWEIVGGYDENETMRLGYEDWEYWIRCIKRGCKVVPRNEIGLLYRIHSNSMTRTTSHKNDTVLRNYIRGKHPVT